MTPSLTLHILPFSHPCQTAIKAIEFKGLDYERVDLTPGRHDEEVAAIYGEGRTTVPGLVVDGEPVHGSRAILARLDQIQPEPPLYAGPDPEAIRDAERWGDEELQDVGRSLSWGAMHFRPESLATYGGGPPLDPAGTDFAIKIIRGGWRYNEVSCERIANDLAELPAKLEHIESLAADGIIGGEQPNAADLQIGATIRILSTIRDLAPLLEGTAAERIALAHFADYPGEVPAGAFPAGWVPTPA